MKPLVSVVIAAYNAERYIIESIESILNQKNAPTLELIIVNDGSTDNTASIIKQYIQRNDLNNLVRLIEQENKGVAVALNHGLDFINGAYLAFNDADDIWHEEKLTKQLDVLENQPNIDMVFGYIKQFYSPELSEKQRAKYFCPKETQTAIMASCILIRTSSFFKVGKFSCEWRTGHFIDWYSRARAISLKHVMLDCLVYYRRIHTSNMGITMRDSRMDYLQIVKQALKRQRVTEAKED